MRPSRRRALLWQGAGLLLTLVGMVLFLVVTAGAFFAPPAYSLANLTTGDLALILGSTALLAVGRALVWKGGGEGGAVLGAPVIPRREPDRSTLEELGYRLPPEDADEGRDGGRPEGGEARVTCPECGAANDPGFRYCNRCSGRLPE